jgi:5-methylcytosine-specific restriction endonuclease McrA
MITLAEFSLEEIMPLIGLGKPDIKLEVHGQIYSVKASSLRLECFKRNPNCVGVNRPCGIRGKVFRLQRHEYNAHKMQTNCFIKDCPWCSLSMRQAQRKQNELETPHLNLYGSGRRNRELVLMTRDHTIPRSKGGPDVIENLQTMCHCCNQYKADFLLQELQDAYPVRAD